MEIIQKKGSDLFTFNFNDEKLSYAYRDKSGSGDFDIYYGDIAGKALISIVKNEWLRNVGLVWTALGAFQMLSAFLSDSTLAGTSFWLILGLGCLIGYRASKVSYSVYKSENANIHVIQDSQHDRIVSEILSRRKRQLLLWHGEINMDNGVERERNKFRWLQEQKVLTKEEADRKIALLELAHKDDLAPSEGRVH